MILPLSSFALRYTDQIRWRISIFSSLFFTKNYYIGQLKIVYKMFNLLYDKTYRLEKDQLGKGRKLDEVLNSFYSNSRYLVNMHK